MSVAENIETSQYLTFNLGNDIFAIDVVLAKEVLDLVDVTMVPHTPEYMLGVINLRSSVVPVIDLRLKFGMPARDRTRDSCIIVVEVAIDSELVTVGVLADSVQEVMNMNESQIEPPPKIGSSLDIEFIKGMGSLDDKFVIIIDIDRIFTVDELQMFEGMLQPDSELEKAMV